MNNIAGPKGRNKKVKKGVTRNAAQLPNLDLGVIMEANIKEENGSNSQPSENLEN